MIGKVVQIAAIPIAIATDAFANRLKARLVDRSIPVRQIPAEPKACILVEITQENEEINNGQSRNVVVALAPDRPTASDAFDVGHWIQFTL